MNLQKWPVDRLKPYPNNVKKHGPEQVAKIAQSIKTFGWNGAPIVVDLDDVIIAGHGRRLAALELGMTHVPVLVRDDLTKDQANALRLADNRAAEGDLDMNLLRIEMAELDLGLLGGIFDEKELDFTTADLGEMNDGAFINDLDAAVTKQAADTEQKAAGLKEKRIPLRKALGFTDIAGSDEIYVSRFMAEIERQSSLKGEAAFMAFVRGLVGEVA
jgi:hypothetical protein